MATTQYVRTGQVINYDAHKFTEIQVNNGQSVPFSIQANYSQYINTNLGNQLIFHY